MEERCSKDYESTKCVNRSQAKSRQRYGHLLYSRENIRRWCFRVSITPSLFLPLRLRCSNCSWIVESHLRGN